VHDAAERQAWGRPLFTQYKDERTPGGIGVDVDIAFDELVEKSETDVIEEIQLTDVGDEIEVDDDQQSEDVRTAEEMLAEYKENF
jgi:hypothetical protein